MSAERNRSKGAPFWICAKKLPDEPVLVFNVTSGWALVYWRFNSSRQNTRSDAAAMATVSAQRPAAGTKSRETRKVVRIIQRAICITSEDCVTLAEERLVCKPRPWIASTIPGSRLAALNRTVEHCSARRTEALPCRAVLGAPKAGLGIS